MRTDRNNSCVHGFTLLELILVMVILSTVLAMAAPSLRGFFALRETHDAAARILALAQLARSQAVCQGYTYRLNVDDGKGTYWLTARNGGAFEELGIEPGRVFTLPRDTVMELKELGGTDGEQFVEFTPDGRVTPGTIRLVNRQGEAVELTCPSATEMFAISTVQEDDDVLTR